MKKKLEAELISIAHRILKLKNRAELDQLQQETLKLYEKLSVLRFVEDNFNDVKPTIGFASAEEKLEEIYSIATHAPDNKKDEATQEADFENKEQNANKADATANGNDKTDVENHENETEANVEANSKEENTKPETDKEEKDTEETEADKAALPEGDADPEQKVEEYQASEEEKEHTEEETDETVSEGQKDESSNAADAEDEKPVEQPEEEEEKEEVKPAEPEKPEVTVEVVKPEEEIKSMEQAAATVYKQEQASSIEDEEKASDAEMITLAPDEKTTVEAPKIGFDFAFERKPAPEEPKKEQKEITFEDYHHDYKEPEFVKKSDADSNAASGRQEPQATNEPKAPEAPKPVEEQKPQPPKEEAKPAPRSFNESMGGKTITLGLNDRIAFEKQLFGGSGEDLNRVLSQLNTFDKFDDARNFIEDLVKPDYNNWNGKEEYEERFMAIVEKKFD